MSSHGEKEGGKEERRKGVGGGVREKLIFFPLLRMLLSPSQVTYPYNVI